MCCAVAHSVDASEDPFEWPARSGIPPQLLLGESRCEGLACGEQPPLSSRNTGERDVRRARHGVSALLGAWRATRTGRRERTRLAETVAAWCDRHDEFPRAEPS